MRDSLGGLYKTLQHCAEAVKRNLYKFPLISTLFHYEDGIIDEMDGRSVSNVSLSPKAKRLLRAVANDLKMTQQGLFGELLEWFVEQDRLTQLLVLRLVKDEDAPSISEILYRKHHGLSLPRSEEGDLTAVAEVERAARSEPKPRPPHKGSEGDPGKRGKGARVVRR